MDLMWSVLNAKKPVSSYEGIGQKFGDTVGGPQYKDMVYQRSIRNPYSSDSVAYTAYEKGFTECWETFSKAEPNPMAAGLTLK